MAQATPHYGIATGVAADDFIDPSHHNDVADTLDRVLGGIAGEVLAAGAQEGWQILSSGEVSGGRGLVARCWCVTQEARAITGLQPAEMNLVYAVATAGSPTTGDVVFVAQLSAPGPQGSVFLGILETDASGEVLSVDNDAPGIQRGCHRIEFGVLSGEATIALVPAGGTVEEVVDHSNEGEFRVPGHMEVSSTSVDFSWRVVEHCRGDGFVLSVTNMGSQPTDFGYTWVREGLLN